MTTRRERGWWVAAAVLAVGCAPRELRVTMNADNNSGQSGFAVLTQLGDGVRIEVETAAPDEPYQPIHVHLGTCGEAGLKVLGLVSPAPVEGNPSVFRSVTELTSRNVGEARIEGRPVDRTYLDLDAFVAAPHVINVHDARDMGVWVSCGEIRE